MSSRLRGPLLRWYRRHRRALPWRRNDDPYAVWIAETMLQQTRSDTVRRYYPPFLERFPTLVALARAPQAAVLARWSGLGYYARGRNLWQAARIVVRRHGGRLPADPAVLRRLPGVGRYTAGAVASIAFGVPAAVVDGNVARVLARHFAVAGDPRSPAVARKLWAIAEELVPERSPGDWNQALMELGATLCTPRTPCCARCPIRTTCEARRTGRVDRFPQARVRPATRKVRRASIVLERGDRLLLEHRGEGRLLRGLWEFPNADASTASPVRVASEVAARLGARVALRRAAIIRHTIMNQRIETHVFVARIDGALPGGDSRGARWFRRRDLASLPLSTVGLQIASLPRANISPESAS